MLRRLSLLAILSAAAIVPAGGCRSCESCHDYSPPVSDCHCDSCGSQRAGSAVGGYVATGHAGGPTVSGGEWVEQ